MNLIEGWPRGKSWRQDEDRKRRQKRKQTSRRFDNKEKHGGRLQDIASSDENMRKFAV